MEVEVGVKMEVAGRREREEEGEGCGLEEKAGGVPT